MANDINIKIRADGKQAEKEIKNVKSTLDTLSNIGNIVTGVKSGLGIVKEAFDKVKDTVFELNELYNVQSDAETRLEVAARNNPYLDQNSITALKNYAGELQNIGEIGDESLLPMMANLAASGRTQEQIQNIMRAALEASATGLIDMNTAVQSLNGSLNGSVGALGKLLPNLKNLTAEELKSGKAIEEVRKAYDGMSESTANPLVQLSNAWGDLKEVIGGAVNTVLVPITQFFTKMVVALTNAASTVKDFFNNFKMLKNEIEDTTVTTDFVDTQSLDNAKEKFDKLKEAIASTQSQIYELENASKEESETLKRQAEENAKAVEEFNKELAQSDAGKQYKELREQIDLSKNKVKELNDVLKTQKEELQNLQDLNRSSFDNTRAERIKVLKSEIETETKELKKQEKQIKRNQNTIGMYYIDWEKRVNEFKKLNIAQIGATGGTTAQLQAQKQLLQTYSQQADEAERTYNELKKQYDLQEQKKTVRAYVPTEDDKKVENALKAYKETVRQKEREIEARKQLGEVIEDEIYYQEMLNAKTNAYKTFWQTTGSLGRTAGESLRNDIEKTSESLKNSLKSIGDDENDYFKKYDEIQTLLSKWNKETKDEQIEILQAQKDKLQEYLDTGNATEDQLKKIVEAFKEIDYAIEKIKVDKIADSLDKFNQVYSNVSQTISEISNLAIESIDTKTQIEIAKVQKLYEEGLVSQENYEAKKEDLEKEAAQKQYKYKMWEWSANLLQIGTNTALAVTKALGEGAILGPVLAASIAALGTVQLTAAIANKPIPPSFATGGIVQGSSYYGDNVKANVNSGEMILNASQQKELWNLANGNGYTPKGLNVKINNFMGGVANVQPKMSNDELEIIIQSVVNAGLENGDFDAGLTTAQNRQIGIEYTS